MSTLLQLVRRVAFLHAHVLDRSDGQALLNREMTRLYESITAHDGGEEPDLTFCCGCREEIEHWHQQYVVNGAKYHPTCVPA